MMLIRPMKRPETGVGTCTLYSRVRFGSPISTSGIFAASELATVYSFQWYLTERQSSHPIVGFGSPEKTAFQISL